MWFLPNYLSMIGLMFPLTDTLKHMHSAIVLTPLKIDGTRLDLLWKNNAAILTVSALVHLFDIS